MKNKYETLLNEIERRKAKLIQIKMTATNETEIQTIDQEIDMLIKKYDLLKEKGCSHPQWLYLSEEFDSNSSRTLFTCKCLECEKIETNYGVYFNDVVEGEYELVKKEYEDSKLGNIDKTKKIAKKRQVWFRK